MNTTTKYQKIAQRIEHMVSSGILNSGDKIPSIRSMSKQTGFSIMTVLEGYKLLEIKKIIASKEKSGYFVRPRHLRTSAAWIKPPEAETETIQIKAVNTNVPKVVRELFDQAENKRLIPFGAGLPSPRFFPSEQLSIHMARIIRNNPDGVNQYSLGQGELVLRTELAKLMIEAGCHLTPEHIFVTTGATQALLTAIRSVTRPGDAVLVESPGYFGFYQLLNFTNLKVIEVPSNPQTGMSIEHLEFALKKNKPISALLLSSCHSNPTGAVIPDQNKIAIAELCRSHKCTIIEDDTYGELTFNNVRPKPIKAFLPEQVIYIGNLNKVLSPGYRVAWLAGSSYQEDIRRCHNMSVLANPLPTQLALASYLQKKGLTKHLQRLRQDYSECVSLFQNEIAQAFPAGIQSSYPSGGHFLWIKLPDTVDSEILAQQAYHKGISLAPGSAFSINNNYRNYLRINCAIPWSKKISNALHSVGQLARKYC